MIEDGAGVVDWGADSDLDANNLCARRASGAAGQFTSLFLDSYSQAGDPTPDEDAGLVNAFYWVNALHDWAYRLGFDEAASDVFLAFVLNRLLQEQVPHDDRNGTIDQTSPG